MRILLTEKQSTIRELNRSLRGKSGQRGSITPLIRWIDYGANRVAPLAANIVAPLSANELAPYWCQSTDIKAELHFDLILLLDEWGYPPIDRDEVYKEIFEQAENFKKYQGAYLPRTFKKKRRTTV